MSCDMILRQLISDTSELYAQLRRAGSAGSANGESQPTYKSLLHPVTPYLVACRTWNNGTFWVSCSTKKTDLFFLYIYLF